MKKVKILVGLIALMSIGNAQVTFYKEFVGYNIISTAINAKSPQQEDYYVNIPDSSTVHLYNRKLEIIKTFHFQNIEGISSIYRNVFTKSGKLEFFVVLSNSNPKNCYLVNEDGTVLYDFQDYLFYTICDDYLLMYKIEYVNNKYKYRVRVYTLDNYDASVQSVQKEVSVRVFPNPARNFINIEHNVSQPETLEIFDASGKVLQTAVLTPGNTSYRVNFNQPAGIYFYRHQSGSGTFVVK